MSRDGDRSAPARRRGPFRLIRVAIFSDYALCEPVKCAINGFQIFAVIRIVALLLGCPVSLQPATEAIHKSLQNGQEKECERCPCDCARRRWNPGFKEEVVTSACVEIGHHHHHAGCLGGVGCGVKARVTPWDGTSGLQRGYPQRNGSARYK